MPLDQNGYDPQHVLNHMGPAASIGHLGDMIYDLTNAYNALQAKYELLLAHLDTANVAGIGDTNVATFGDTAQVLLPEQRS